MDAATRSYIKQEIDSHKRADLRAYYLARRFSPLPCRGCGCDSWEYTEGCKVCGRRAYNRERQRHPGDTHGTFWNYGRGCRCKQCKTAYAVYRAGRRRDKQTA